MPSSDSQGSNNRPDLKDCRPMVDWFSPSLLAMAGFHSIVARLFGQFADNRTVHYLDDSIRNGSSDGAYDERLANRHDYSSEAVGAEPFWVDYAADLGDGFDSTYAVAYTLAASGLMAENAPVQGGALRVKDLHGKNTLQPGRILVMGGDQVYPWPSREEYDSRLCLPFNWALPGKDAPVGGEREAASRDVYAIPGNHDWYDGLASFDDLFCRARGAKAGRQKERLGDWETNQHRSYFAIKLPHNWWIWGVDTQLNVHVDSGQLEYFRAVSEAMQPGDQFIICAAEPSWYYANTKHERVVRKNLEELTYAPIVKGVTLCGLFSGDTHHYARYVENDTLGNFNFFTIGGGGAYTHGTHHLAETINFNWLGQSLLLRLNRRLRPHKPNDDDLVEAKPKQTNEPACYPSKPRSKGLAWRNLLFPFRNWRFSLSMGAVYWLLTWTFARLEVCFRPSTITVGAGDPGSFYKKYYENWASTCSDPGASPSIVKNQIDNMTLVVTEQYYNSTKSLSALVTMFTDGLELLLRGMANSPFALAFILAIWGLFYFIADSKLFDERSWWNKAILGTFHFLMHLAAMWVCFCGFIYFNQTKGLEAFEQISRFSPVRVFDGLGAVISDKPDESFLLIPIDIWVTLLYPLEIIIIGGSVAGLIFGFYLLFGYIAFKINTDWTFSAQRIPHYKCFLRMRFERDKLTIYPIGIDCVPTSRPGRPAWRVVRDPEPGRPLVEPVQAFEPHLVEGPIEIRVEDVVNIKRT